MNTKKIIYTIGLLVGFLYMLTSCEEDETGQSELPYLFRPIKFEVVTNKTVATLTWAPVDSAISYTIEISQDSLTYENIIITDTVTTTNYVVELAGKTRFSARVKANASNSVRDSKFNQTLTFKTPSENLFADYKSFMLEQNEALLSWSPGANATHLKFSAEGKTAVDFPIDNTEKSTGKKIITSLDNGEYTVELYNNQILRGTVKVTIEGDYYVRSGDNLATVLNSITKDSAIIVIKPGIFSLGAATFNFTKNIKIRGLFADTVPIICMEGATATTNMFNINSTTHINFIRFENIDISGMMGGGATGSRIGYGFNQSSACDVGEINFKNCIIRNFGNTPVRLKDANPKLIEILNFQNCIIFDIGYLSTYAVVNNNVAGCTINNISFTNSTVYNFTGSLILHTSTSVNSVLIENCTFNEITTSGTAATIRYMIDFSAANNVTNGINISNCIFGSTPRKYTEGVRVNASTNKMISGSYMTNDFFDNNAASGYSIISSLNAYSGASTDLFTSPLTGNFKIKDVAFVGKSTAGDPRWRP